MFESLTSEASHLSILFGYKICGTQLPLRNARGGNNGLFFSLPFHIPVKGRLLISDQYRSTYRLDDCSNAGDFGGFPSVLDSLSAS